MSLINGFQDVIADWGAIGDGRNNDTPNIQNALDAVMAGGGVVYFPPGTYMVEKSPGPALQINGSGIELRGAGPGVSVIKVVRAFGQTVSSTAVATSKTTEIDFVSIRDLGFVGDGILDGFGNVADPVIAINGGKCHQVADCYFNNNSGETIFVGGATDVEVMRCHFDTVGSNTGTAPDANAIRLYRDGSGQNTFGGRVHDNFVTDAQYGAFHVNAAQCDVSHNVLVRSIQQSVYVTNTNVGSSDTNSDTRVGFNSSSQAKEFPAGGTGGGTGVYGDQPTTVTIIGNNVSHGDGAGIPVNGWVNAVLVGNNVWDNCVQENITGFQILGQANAQPGNVNSGLVVVANNSCDDRIGSSVTQPNGFRGFRNSSADPTQLVSASSIVANATYGISNQGILEEDQEFQALTCTMYGNTDWRERLHSTTQKQTSGTAVATLASPTVRAQAMGDTGGFHFRAGGTCTSGGFLSVGFGIAANLAAAQPIGTSAANWEVIVTVVNNSNMTNVQAATVTILHGTAVTTVETTLTGTSGIDTTSAQTLFLQGQTFSGTMFCDYSVLNRL